jgi:hypothetical protein
MSKYHGFKGRIVIRMLLTSNQEASNGGIRLGPL